MIILRCFWCERMKHQHPDHWYSYLPEALSTVLILQNQVTDFISLDYGKKTKSGYDLMEIWLF